MVEGVQQGLVLVGTFFTWCFLGQCRILGEAIVGRKRWEERVRGVCVMGVVAQHTRRRLRAAFTLSNRAVANSRCELYTIVFILVI